MDNDDLQRRFSTWLLASGRSDGTIKLRTRHVRALATTHDLLTVSEDDLEAVLARSRRLADETRKSMVASWRLFFGLAHRKGWRPDDPTIALESVKVKRKMPRLADDAELTVALERASARDRAMILLGREVWLRLSEITTLHTDQRWGDRLRIRGKGGVDRIAYLTPAAAAALDALEREQGTGYYFPGAVSGHMHREAVHKVIKRATGFNPHALRHRGATEGFRSTRNIRAVQEQLGHASVATTQIYTHLEDDERRAVVASSTVRSLGVRPAA